MHIISFIPKSLSYKEHSFFNIHPYLMLYSPKLIFFIGRNWGLKRIHHLTNSHSDWPGPCPCDCQLYAFSINRQISHSKYQVRYIVSIKWMVITNKRKKELLSYRNGIIVGSSWKSKFKWQLCERMLNFTSIQGRET